MKVRIRLGNAVIEAEGEKHADLWEQLSNAQEAFSTEPCGKCNDSNVRYVTRENDDGDKFFELHCTKCYAKLRMSQRKKGGNLYPRRKAGENDASGLEQGAWLPNRGWMKWNRDTNKEE
jgi:hypothetical protein